MGVRLGRPPAGAHGQKTSEYIQLTLRLPPAAKRSLDALCGMTGWPIWRVVEAALAAYVRELPPHEQRLLHGVRQRRAKHQ
jgi:hypothetical protein